jgi:hypothetical protein
MPVGMKASEEDLRRTAHRFPTSLRAQGHAFGRSGGT